MSKLDIAVFIASSSQVRSSTPVTIAEGRMNPSSVVYWLRVALGLGTALLIYLLQLKGTTPVVTVALTMYLASVLVVKFVLRYTDAHLKGRGRTVTLGAGSFIMIWLAVLVLLYTLAPY
jgi:hypothetical protein